MNFSDFIKSIFKRTKRDVLTEKKARVKGDEALQSQIKQVNDRITNLDNYDDAELRAAISEEITARGNADTALGNRVTANETDISETTCATPICKLLSK